MFSVLRVMKCGLRAVSALTLICFVTTGTAWGLPDAGISGMITRETPTFLQIEIPQNLASIEDIYEAPAKADPSLILHIQNLHGNYEAQTQIKKLLDYLYKTYAFKLIFVEGAAEKLNADYLRLFSDDEQNRELADYLTHKGQLTGPEFYLVDGPKDVQAVGIEQEDLYRKNLEAFRKVYGAKDTIDKKLNAYDAKIDSLSTVIFTPAARRNISEWRKFESGHRDFLPYVKRLSQEAKKVLGLDLESLFAQVEWPQITRLLVIQSMEADLNKTASEEERTRLVQFLTKSRVDDEIISAVKKLGERRISMSRLDASGKENRLENLPRYLLERLVAEAGPKGFYFHDYPAFSLYAGYLILQSELQSQALYEEINLLFEKILAEQTPTEKERNLLELFRDAELLKKLLHLELTRKEWQRAAYRKEWINPQTVERRLKDLEAKPIAAFEAGNGSGSLPGTPAINGYFETSLEFYDFARAREGAFFEKIEKEMGESQSDKAVLVTGGFHTDGLMDLFRENNINYGVLLPRISGAGLSAENKYSEAMMESGSTMFDLATIEISSILHDPKTFEAMGGANWERVQTLYDGFAAKGKFPSIEAGIDFINRSLFADRHKVYLRQVTSDSVAIQIEDASLIDEVRKGGVFAVDDEGYLRAQQTNRYFGFKVTSEKDTKTSQPIFKLRVSQLDITAEEIKSQVSPKTSLAVSQALVPLTPRANPSSVPMTALSENRTQKESKPGLSRRNMLSRTALAVTLGLTAAGSFFVYRNLDSEPEAPVDPLTDPDLSAVAKDTLQGLLKLRNPANGMPFNQTPGFKTPETGWLKSSDIGFMWTADILMAAQHARQLTQEETAHPDQVTRRILESLKMYQKMVNSFGLKINGKKTGILPEFLIHQKEFFKTRKDPVPGTDRREGVTFSSYDMLLTLQRLKIMRDVFQGERVPGLESSEIVNLANELLSQTTLEPFVDEELRIHHQIVQDGLTQKIYLSEHVMDNAHTEARGLVHILDQFGNADQTAEERSRRGEEIWKRLTAQWTDVRVGSNTYSVLQGDSALSVYTEFYGSSFWSASGDLKLSNINYAAAAQAVANANEYKYFGTAPGTGDMRNSYAQFGLLKPDRTVIAGPAMLVTNGDRASFEQMILLSRDARKSGAYQSGWGFLDQISPLSGKPDTRFGRNNHNVIYMNNGLVAESLHYFILREIMSQSPDREMIERNLSVELVAPAALSLKSPPARSDVRTSIDNKPRSEARAYLTDVRVNMKIEFGFPAFVRPIILQAFMNDPEGKERPIENFLIDPNLGYVLKVRPVVVSFWQGLGLARKKAVFEVVDKELIINLNQKNPLADLEAGIAALVKALKGFGPPTSDIDAFLRSAEASKLKIDPRLVKSIRKDLIVVNGAFKNTFHLITRLSGRTLSNLLQRLDTEKHFPQELEDTPIFGEEIAGEVLRGHSTVDLKMIRGFIQVMHKTLLTLQRFVPEARRAQYQELIDFIKKSPNDFEESLKTYVTLYDYVAIPDYLLEREEELLYALGHERLHLEFDKEKRSAEMTVTRGMQLFYEKGGKDLLERIFSETLYEPAVLAMRQGNFGPFLDEFWVNTQYPIPTMFNTEKKSEFIALLQTLRDEHAEFRNAIELVESMRERSDKVAREDLKQIKLYKDSLVARSEVRVDPVSLENATFEEIRERVQASGVGKKHVNDIARRIFNGKDEISDAISFETFLQIVFRGRSNAKAEIVRLRQLLTLSEAVPVNSRAINSPTRPFEDVFSEVKTFSQVDASKPVDGQFFVLYNPHGSEEDYLQVEPVITKLIEKTGKDPEMPPRLYAIAEGYLLPKAVRPYLPDHLKTLPVHMIFTNQHKAILKEFYTGYQKHTANEEVKFDSFSLEERYQFVQSRIPDLNSLRYGELEHLLYAKTGIRIRSEKMDFETWYRFTQHLHGPDSESNHFYRGDMAGLLAKMRRHSTVLNETVHLRDRAVNRQVQKILQEDPLANVVYVVGIGHLMDKDELMHGLKGEAFMPEEGRIMSQAFGFSGIAHLKTKYNSFESDDEERNLRAKGYLENALTQLHPKGWTKAKIIESVTRVFENAESEHLEAWEALTVVSQKIARRIGTGKIRVGSPVDIAEQLHEMGWLSDGDFSALMQASRSEVRGEPTREAQKSEIASLSFDKLRDLVSIESAYLEVEGNETTGFTVSTEKGEGAALRNVEQKLKRLFPKYKYRIESNMGGDRRHIILHIDPPSESSATGSVEPRSEVRQVNARPADEVDEGLKLGGMIDEGDIPETAPAAVIVALKATLSLTTDPETFNGIWQILRNKESQGSKTQYDEIIRNLKDAPGIEDLLNKPGILAILADRVPEEKDLRAVAGLVALNPNLAVQIIIKSEKPLTSAEQELLGTIKSGKDRAGNKIGIRFDMSVLNYDKAIQYKLGKIVSKLAGKIAGAMKAKGGESAGKDVRQAAQAIQQNFAVLGLEKMFENITLTSGKQVIGAGDEFPVYLDVQALVSARLSQGVNVLTLREQYQDVITQKPGEDNVFYIVEDSLVSIGKTLTNAFEKAYKIATSA